MATALPGTGGGEDSTTDDVVEAFEQQLIQHLRTAGLRQQREVELINEVMNIRRERRKSFTGVRTLVRRMEEDNRILRERCTSLLRERESEAVSRKAMIAQALHKKETELIAMSKQHEMELNTLKEKFAQVNKQQIARISKIYEEKLKAVDEKLQELDAARNGHEQRTAQAIAMELTEKAVVDVTVQHRIKLQKYKDALRSVTEKERDAVQTLQQIQDRLKDSEQDKRVIADNLRRTEEYVSRFQDTERTWKANLLNLQSSLEATKAQLHMTQTELNAQRTFHTETLTHLNEQHATELEEVDNKVRKALQNRDDKIKILHEKMLQAEQSQMQAEQVLTELNEGLGIAKRSSRPSNGQRR